MENQPQKCAADTGRTARFSPWLKWLLISGIAWGFVFNGSAWAVHDLFGNIELDGNTTNDGVSVPGEDDWDDVYDDCQADPECDSLTTGALRQIHVNDSGTDFTVFNGGLKDILPISDWTCNSSPVQGKSDIQFAYGATYTEEGDGDLVFYGGADRATVQGSANFGVWLLQEPVSCDSTGNGGGTTPFTGVHLHGDLLLVAEFEQGGSVSFINVYKWTDPTPLFPESGDECLGNGADCGAGEGLPFATGVNCRDSVAGDFVCGITNDDLVGAIDAAWRPGIPEQGFYEVGANLTNLIEGIGCFATALIETRSSTSLTATIKDFAFLDLSTCGTLEVEKVTSGGTGSFDFEISPTAGGPDSFSLTGGQSQPFNTVEPGTFTITESGLPAGPAAPSGWNLTDVSCVGGTAETPDYVNDGHGGGSIDVQVGLSDDVVCTFTNTFTPPPSSITITKTCDSVTADLATFGYQLTGFGGSSTADCADGTVELACSGSITCQGLGAGEYQINENVVPAGWTLSGVSCSGGSSSTCGPAETPDAFITLAADQSATAAFANTETASITICKDTAPSGVGGDFEFTSAGALGDFDLADGECTEAIAVTPDVAQVIAEQPKAGFVLDDVTCEADEGSLSWSSNGSTLTVTPDAGQSVLCTFDNSELPGFVRVCKVTVSESPTSASFTVNLAGPDSDLPVSSSLQNGDCDFGPADENSVNLLAGSGYSVSESPASNWTAAISCTGPQGAENPNNITVYADETVNCTVTNTFVPPPPPPPPPTVVSTLNRYGLAILALLMLGVGLVGYRRFG